MHSFSEVDDTIEKLQTALFGSDVDTVHHIMALLLHKSNDNSDVVGRLVQLLIPMLEHEDLQVRLRVISALSLIRQPAIIEILYKLLDDPFVEIQVVAIKVLGNSHIMDARPLLLSKLTAKDGRVREAVAESLGELASPDVIEPLTQLLSDPNNEVRKSAVFSLFQCVTSKEVDVVSLLKPLLHTLKNDLDFDVREGAAQILGLSDEKSIVPALIESLENTESSVVIRSLGKVGGQHVINVLLRHLKSTDRNILGQCAEELGNIGEPYDRNIYDALLSHINNEHILVRCNAIEALCKIGRDWAVPILINSLSDEDYHVRLSAAECLNWLKANAAIKPLLVLLNDESDAVRHPVIDFLGQFEDKQAVEPLIEMLKVSNSYTRGLAARSLGYIGDHAALPALEQLVSQNDIAPFLAGYSVKDAAAKAIARIKEPSKYDKFASI